MEHPHEEQGNALRARAEAIIGRGQDTFTPTRAVITEARGTRLTTVDGRQLIDFAAGVLVANLGHAHPLFEERLAHYRAQLPRTAYNMLTPLLVEASERLAASLGIPAAQRVLWAASGSEAIQKAMWCAIHRRPKRHILLATRGGFHGKKGLAGDVSGETSPNPNVHFLTFPHDATTTPSDIEQELDTITRMHPDQVALLITEPYLGAAGSFHPPAWYHQLLAHWCTEHDVPLIFDEVQACHGRTGHMYAFQAYGVSPDLVVLGKGLGNGVPAAAVVGPAGLIDTLDYGEASDTFSANPEACAAVCAVLDVFEAENVLQQCRAAAEKVRTGLDALLEKFPFINAVRGEGLVYGVEMTDADTANRCVREAYYGADGLGVHFLGPLANKVLRVSPPLVIDNTEIDRAFNILDKAWERVGKGR
ncbi:MAG: aspartate aminotransferase family protein [Candidatus Hydrogenedentota bacterium]